MNETRSTSSSATRSTSPPGPPQQLRSAWRIAGGVVGLAVCGARALARQLVSSVFLCHVMTPFAVWSVVLLWANARCPEKVVQVVAAGPVVVVQCWIIVLQLALAVVFALRRYREAQALMLAIATLVLSAIWLPPLPAATFDDEPPPDAVILRP